jgi:predicted nucleic acid-binding Zn ribbon protein
MALFVYDYKCNNCGYEGEAWVENKDSIICYRCSSLNVTLLWLSPPNIDTKWSPYRLLDKRVPDARNPTVSVPANYKKGD